MTDLADGTTPSASAAGGRGPKRRRSWKIVVIGATGALLAYAATSAAGGLSDAVHVLRHSDVRWALPALFAVAVRYSLIAHQLRLLRGPATAPSPRLAVGIALVAFGLGGVLPASPAEGITMAVVELRRRGMAARQSIVMLLASQWFQFWSIVVILALDRAIVAFEGRIHRPLVQVTVVSAFLLLITATAGFLARREVVAERVALATRWVPGQRQKTCTQLIDEGLSFQHALQATIGTRVHRTLILVTTITALLLDAGILWCTLHMVRAPVSFDIAVLAYTAALVVAWVPLLPSGLGLTEIAIPALLSHFGVPTAAGLSAILLWRAISLFLPALAGLAVYSGLRVDSDPTKRRR